MATSTAEKEVYRPGGIVLTGIEIFNFKKKSLVLTGQTVEFNIFQDIYAQGTKCEVGILDSNGIIEMLPIVGDETLVVKFRTPTFDTELNYVFKIYKITSRAKEAARAEVFVLHGVSQEVISDRRKSLKTSYLQLKPEKIIESIYENYLRPTIEEFGIIEDPQP